jgi:hypothetical protein
MAQFAVFALWAAVAVVIIIGVFAFVFLATISDVQLASVTSKLGGKPGSSSGVVVPAILTLLMLWTLLLEGGSLVFAAVSAASRSRKKALVLAVFLIAATALSGTLMVFLSVELFSRFNVVEIDYSLLNGLLGICVAANLVVMAGGLCLGRLFTSRK